MKYLFTRKGMLSVSVVIICLGVMQVYRFYISGSSSANSTIGKLSGVDVLVTGLGMLLFVLTRKEDFFE